MNLWRNADGTLIVGTNGNPVLCDDCPCGALCRGVWPSSFFVFGSNDLGTQTFEGTIVNTAPTCFTGSVNDCGWAGTLSVVLGGPSSDRRVELFSSLTFARFRVYLPTSDAYPVCGVPTTDITHAGSDDPTGVWVGPITYTVS